MATSSAHVAALVRYHAQGDDSSFRTVALQVAANEARAGHTRVAGEIKKSLDAAAPAARLAAVTRLPVPGDDLDELTSVSQPAERLGDLVADPDLEAQLRRVIQERRNAKALELHGFTPIHRLLLEGPPGTGKTMTARVIAGELGLPLRVVRLDGLLSRYMGQTSGKLRTIFDAVASMPGVYLFDEIDALAADRTGNDVGEARRILNSLLVLLEEASSRSVVIAATNHRALLDRAVFRRFDAVLTYRLPDEAQVAVLIRNRLGAMARDIDESSLADHAVGLSHAEVVKAAESAAKTAVMADRPRVSTSDLACELDARRTQSGGSR